MNLRPLSVLLILNILYERTQEIRIGALDKSHIEYKENGERPKVHPESEVVVEDESVVLEETEEHNDL